MFVIHVSPAMYLFGVCRSGCLFVACFTWCHQKDDQKVDTHG